MSVPSVHPIDSPSWEMVKASGRPGSSPDSAGTPSAAASGATAAEPGSVALKSELYTSLYVVPTTRPVVLRDSRENPPSHVRVSATSAVIQLPGVIVSAWTTSL
jgi:hypothetical protein